MVLTIWKQPAAYAGIDAAIGPGQTYQVLDATASNFGSVNWTLIGQGTLMNTNILSPVFIPEPGQTGTVTLMLTVYPEGGEICDPVTDEMTISIGEQPGIAIEKRTVQVVMNNDGSATVTFEFNFENTGNVTLTDLSLTDNLSASFPGSCIVSVLSLTSGNFNINPGYNGISDIELLASGNTIDVNAKKAVLLTINVLDCNESQTYFVNTTGVSAISPGGQSLSGTDTSEINFRENPAVGLAKQLVSLTNNENGTYSAEFSFRVRNYGDVTLSDISLTDNLDLTFGTGNFLIKGISSETFATNEAYNGSDQFNLLLPGNSLGVGMSGAISLIIEILTSGMYYNTSVIQAITPRGSNVSDTSTEGTDPAPGGNNNPNDFSVPTEINATDCITASVFAGNNAEICPSSIYKVHGSSASNYERIEWTTSGDGSFSFTDILEPIYTPGQSDIANGTVTLRLTAFSFEPCPPVSSTMQLIIEDITPPVFNNCHDGQTFIVGMFSGACQGGAIWSRPTATDNCSDVTIEQTSGPEPGALLSEGTYEIEYTATDNSGNSSVCRFTIRIVDTQVPILVCRPDINVKTDNTSCTWTSPAGSLSLLFVNSNCPFDITYEITGATTASGKDDASGELFNYGTSTVTYNVVEPESGQSWTCSFDVIVTDETKPELVCGQPIKRNTDPGECHAQINLQPPLFGDNCSNSPATVSFTVWGPDNSISGPFTNGVFTYSFKPGISQVEWNVSDDSGNIETCIQTVEIIDNQRPTLFCPTAIYVRLDNTPGICGAIIPDNRLDATASDNCGQVTLRHNYGLWSITQSLKGATFPVGITTVIWTATDAAGNISECEITVEVTDKEPPRFVNCPSGTTFKIGLFSGSCEGGAIWSIPVATDNCGLDKVIQTKGPDQGSTLPVGTYDIEYMAIDLSGNTAICSFKIEVSDTESPVVVCPPNLIRETDPGSCSWISSPGSLSPLLANSNCPSVLNWVVTNPDGTEVSGFDDVSGYKFNLGVSIVKYYNTENQSGQSSECSFQVTVIDKQSPQIICNESLFANALPGQCFADITLSIPVISDNCADNSNTVSFTVFNPDNTITGPFAISQNTYRFKPGNSIVEWIVSDEFGNTSRCIQQVIINADPLQMQPYAGQNSTICAGSNFELSEASARDYTNILWSTSGSGYFDDVTILNSVYIPGESDIINGSVILTLNVLSECSAISDHLTLNIRRSATINAGDDASICAGSDFRISGANHSNAVTLHWTTSGTGTFSNNQSLNPVYYPAIEDIEAGEVILKLTGTSLLPCINATDSLVLKIIQPSFISAGDDAIICEGSSFRTENAIASGITHVKWETNGTGVFNNPTELNPVYYPSSSDIINGEVVLTLVGFSNSPCQNNSDQLKLIIRKPATITMINESFVCAGSEFLITGTTQANATSLFWTTTGTGTFNNPEILNPIYIPGEDDITAGNVVLTLTAKSDSPCGDAIKSIVLQILPPANVFAGNDTIICEGMPVTLINAIATHATSVQWKSSGTGTFNNSTDINPVYTPSAADIINGSVTLTITGLSASPCATAIDELDVIISKKTYANAGPDSHICSGDVFRITNAQAGNYSALKWTTSGSGVIEGDTDIRPWYRPAQGENGQILLILTASGKNGCAGSTVNDTLILTIHRPLIVDAGDDIPVLYNGKAMLDVYVTNGSGSYFYTWEPESLLFSSGSKRTETRALQSDTRFTVKVTDANSGCIGSDTVNVTVNSNLEDVFVIYNAFSPNGDGVNDTWFIEGIEHFPDNEVMIFNRWGDKIKELFNYDNYTVFWDGTNMQNRKVPDGTYYYVLTVRNAKPITGWIQIRSAK